MSDLQNQPEWLAKDNKVMERMFVSEFLQEHKDWCEDNADAPFQ